MTKSRPCFAKLRIGSTASVAGLALAAVLGASAPAAAADGRLGFVVRDFFIAQYNTKYLDECPSGISMANDEIWWRGMSKEERAKKTDNGLIQVLDRNGVAMRRGPKGEDVCLNPEVVTDPPLKIIEGKFSYGANLDGTTDGSATAKTCKHHKFTGVDGTPAVDNQLYRLVGCTYGWRKGGLIELNANEMRGTSGLGMALIEITNVDNPRNDDDVTVTFYRSIDQFAMDGQGQPLPFTSYRVEADESGKVSYGDTLKGKIKNGVLTTERGDVSIPFYGNYNFMHPVIKDFGLEMTIAEDGASANGMITGYYNVDEFTYYVGGMAGHASAADNCPSLWAMSKMLADGYPDPKTGECTMLSSAFDIQAHAAYVVLPKDQKIVKAAKK